jgi:hypothetical protein
MLIDGMTLVESNTIVSDSVLNFMVAYGVFLIIMTSCICIGFWRWTVDKVPFKKVKFWIIGGVAGGIIIGCLVGKFIMPKPTDWTTILKVELDDSVTIGELREDYIMLEQDGKYYYLERIDKEEEED